MNQIMSGRVGRGHSQFGEQEEKSKRHVVRILLKASLGKFIHSFIHPSIHSFNKYLLRTCFVPGTVQAHRNYQGTNKDLCPHGADSRMERQMIEIKYVGGCRNRKIQLGEGKLGVREGGAVWSQ